MKPGGTLLPSSGGRGAVFFLLAYQIAVAEASVFGLCRSIVVSLLMGAAGICTAAAQPDLDINTREPGEMYAMGVILDEGVGVRPDGRRAFEWYNRAAKLGHAESMNRLGLLYLRGSGVPRSAFAALAWFRLAAAKGSLTAVNNIALLRFYGFGVHQSYSAAAKLLRMSADAGDADAQNKLGVMYDSGLGVAPDHRRAKALFLKSAAQGYSPAILNLGRLLTHGTGGETADVFPYPFSDASKAAATQDSTACITYAVVPTSRSGTTSYP
jgi:TPR repeat protein